MRLCILGAGAARGSLSGDLVVPTAMQFGAVLGRCWPTWTIDLPALRAVVNHLQADENEWALEPVWSCIDWYAKLANALPLPKPWSNEGPQLKKAILRVYGERCTANKGLQQTGPARDR